MSVKRCGVDKLRQSLGRHNANAFLPHDRHPPPTNNTKRQTAQNCKDLEQ
jgi:hypothetical protein